MEAKRALNLKDSFLNGAALQQVGIFAAFILTTIGLATTTNSSRALVEVIRLGSTVLLVGVSFILVLQEKAVSRFVSRAMLAGGLLLSYGVFLAVLKGGVSIIQENLIRDLVLMTAFIYLVAKGCNVVLSEMVAHLCVWYGLIVVALTILSGGLVLDYPPQFILEYAATSLDRTSGYSQGISRFYGFSAIPAAFIAVTATGLKSRIFFGISAFVFLALSALGGARGDSVAALFVVALCVVFYGSGRGRLLVALMVFCFTVILFSFIDYTDFALFNRFMALDGGIGSREMLYRDALRLIGERPDCAYFGCGFGFFQKYYGYAAGNYPHNFILESVIVFGIPLTLTLAVLLFVGLFNELKSEISSNGLFVLVLIFALFVQLKSGTILTAWLLMGGVIYYVARGFSFLLMSRCSQ